MFSIKSFFTRKVIMKNNLTSIKKDFTEFKTKVKAMDRTPFYLALILFGVLALLAITKVIKDSYEKTNPINYSEAMSNTGKVVIYPVGSSSERAASKGGNRPLVEMVEKKISEDPELSSSDIVVITKGGLVFLSGDLSSEEEASKAVEIANSIPGVFDVDTSNLTVDYGIPSKDMIITGKIKGIYDRYRLFGEKSMEDVGLKVETHNGVVSLSGTVHTDKQAKNVVKFAKTINGVTGVNSQITIMGKGAAKK